MCKTAVDSVGGAKPPSLRAAPSDGPLTARLKAISQYGMMAVLTDDSKAKQKEMLARLRQQAPLEGQSTVPAVGQHKRARSATKEQQSTQPQKKKRRGTSEFTFEDVLLGVTIFTASQGSQTEATLSVSSILGKVVNRTTVLGWVTALADTPRDRFDGLLQQPYSAAAAKALQVTRT